MTPVGIFSLGAGKDSGIFTGFFESLLWDCAGNLAAMNRPGDSCVSTATRIAQLLSAFSANHFNSFYVTWRRGSQVENSMNDEDEDGEGGATPSVSSKAATAKTARSSRCHCRCRCREMASFAAWDLPAVGKWLLPPWHMAGGSSCDKHFCSIVMGGNRQIFHFCIVPHMACSAFETKLC